MDLQIAVFASGSGTNFQAILDAIDQGRLRARVNLLITDREQAAAVARAQRQRIPVEVLPPSSFEDDERHGRELSLLLDRYQVNFVVLAGYLKKIPAATVAQFKNRIINIHPALLPAFGGKGMYGKKVHQAVIDYGCKVSGATVHLVDNDYDTGPPILQRCVAVHDDDDAGSLAERVLEVEHRLLPEALALFAAGRVRVQGRRTILAEESRE